jgi:uncharacterized protein (TIGR04255 family)
MKDVEHLSRAPIVEALLDLRVASPNTDLHAGLDEIQSRLSSGYPTKQATKIWTGSFQLPAEGEPVATASESLSGYQFTSTDGKQVVQARPDGFAFSRLHPYTNWSDFLGAARSAWDVYAAVTKPDGISRVALRYINRIPLPAPLRKIGDYLHTGPFFASGLPQSTESLFFRAVVNDEKSAATVVITEAIEESPHMGTVPFILDIDVFRSGYFRADDSLWEQFSSLHEAKNRFFFESITDATKELLR